MMPRAVTPPLADVEAATFPNAEIYRRKRAGVDLYGRSLVGPLFYALGCVVVSSVGGYFHPLRLVASLAPALFLVLFALRRRNRPPARFADTAAYASWRRRHWALIHGGCALWAAALVYVGAVERDASPPLVIAVICSVMFGAALSQAFAMEKRQTTLTLAVLYAPALTLFAVVPPLRAFGVTLVIFSLYLLSSLRRLAREYDTQIETEHALMLSRAEVEKLTRIDALTGLANRREYEHVFPMAWHQAVRQKVDLAVLVFDLDHFKRVNDRHGHLAGDACLQHFAELLRRHFRREVDLVARIGGEEFVAVLPGSGAHEAARMAESFRESLEQSPCGWQGEQLPFTVSVGVGTADWSTDPEPEATFARIDSACYEAKTSGRNRVILASGG
jgi:diguanylate cyclase (GGDEF)-like protein